MKWFFYTEQHFEQSETLFSPIDAEIDSREGVAAYSPEIWRCFGEEYFRRLVREPNMF